MYPDACFSAEILPSVKVLLLIQFKVIKAGAESTLESTEGRLSPATCLPQIKMDPLLALQNVLNQSIAPKL